MLNKIVPLRAFGAIQIIRDILGGGAGEGYGTVSPNIMKGEGGGKPKCHVTFFQNIIGFILVFLPFLKKKLF
jgi:hypothetical protein